MPGIGPGSVIEWDAEGETVVAPAAEAFVAGRSVAAVEMLLNHHHLTVQDADAVSAAVAQFRRRPAVGFSDCLMVEATRKAGHGLLGTFDRHLATIDGAQRL